METNETLEAAAVRLGLDSNLSAWRAAESAAIAARNAIEEAGGNDQEWQAAESVVLIAARRVFEIVCQIQS